MPQGCFFNPFHCTNKMFASRCPGCRIAPDTATRVLKDLCSGFPLGKAIESDRPSDTLDPPLLLENMFIPLLVPRFVARPPVVFLVPPAWRDRFYLAILSFHALRAGLFTLLFCWRGFFVSPSFYFTPPFGISGFSHTGLFAPSVPSFQLSRPGGEVLPVLSSHSVFGASGPTRLAVFPSTK